ncbi:aminotransferase class I/II-fold pyridoxal phosphate-dependent enzyme [Streptomyces sp. NPDC032940]|uniref:aminotransferase class I/II-fold pyridoxal phosphate-dependent enzyme n=1 Tax=Streptomyces sp. NPDC032940 TaxID=3155366 RepID=UPI00340D1AB3
MSGPTPTRALVLAAGMGRRLGRDSDHRPKPLTPIAGVPIVHRSMAALAAAGVTEAVVVTGHLDDVVRASLGDRFAGIDIHYLYNARYHETGDAYSVWLAREFFDRSLYLVEGDIVLREDAFATVPTSPRPNIVFAGEPARRLGGTVVKAAPDGTLDRLYTDREQGPGFSPDGWLKTSNVFLLEGEYLRDGFAPALDTLVTAGPDGDRAYYDYAIVDSLDADRWAVCTWGADEWFEVDDPGDRLQAEYLFSPPRRRRELLTGAGGGYWRFDVRDHRSLRNSGFPTPEMYASLTAPVRELLLGSPADNGLSTELVASVHGLRPGQVCVASGTAELLAALCEAGGPVAVPDPGGDGHVDAVRSAQLVPFTLEPPRFTLDVDAFTAFVRAHGCTAAVVGSPHHRTGVAVPLPELRRLCEALPDVTVLVDESFVDLSAPPAGSLLPHLEEHPNLVVLRDLGEAYGVGGIPLGFAATADPDRAALLRTRLPSPRLGGLAEEFLRVLPHYDKDFRRACARVSADARALAGDLAALGPLTVVPPDAHAVFAGLPEGVSADAVADELFTADRILVQAYDEKSASGGRQWLRITSRGRDADRRVTTALAGVLRRLPMTKSEDTPNASAS